MSHACHKGMASSDSPAAHSKQPTILVVDASPELRDILHLPDCKIDWIENGDRLQNRLQQSDFDVALLDLDGSEPSSSLSVCRQLTTARPDTPVVVMTRHQQLETVVGAMRSGAYDFLTKPLVEDLLQRAVDRALRHRELRCRLKRLSAAVESVRGFPGMIGHSEDMRHLHMIINKVANTYTNVLVTGESGTGKELVAKAIHERSDRSDKPFVGINCGAVSPGLLESELFGHVKGSFTSAKSSRKGLFAHANGGTVLLDEIGEMPLSMQAKLLRALQERRIRPVGGDTEIEFDARIIAATNRDLHEEVRAGRFREDLYYRINVVQIDVPPLRVRGNDVLLLAEHFAKAAAERFGRTTPPVLSPACGRRLLQYNWPGNVRELENAIERAVALTSSGELDVHNLPPAARGTSRGRSSQDGDDNQPWTMATLTEVEASYIQHVIDAVGDNKTRAALVLGVDRRTLYRRLARYERLANQSGNGQSGNGQAGRSAS